MHEGVTDAPFFRDVELIPLVWLSTSAHARRPPTCEFLNRYELVHRGSCVRHTPWCRHIAPDRLLSGMEGNKLMILLDHFPHRSGTEVSISRISFARDSYGRLSEVDLRASPSLINLDDQSASHHLSVFWSHWLASIVEEYSKSSLHRHLCCLWFANKKNGIYPNPHSYITKGSHPHQSHPAESIA